MALPVGDVPMLKQQYRMHPNIAETVSNLFYDNLVTTPVEVAEARRRVDMQGMWCLDVHGKEVYSDRSKSCTNPIEIENAYQTYLLLKDKHPSKTIMIITFYKAQQHAMVKDFKEAGVEESPTLRITTVDQSQGSEADIVILSTVRCNDKHNIGFVHNENRMNVAISRAREQLIVIGDQETFRQNPNWKKIWAACASFPLASLPARR
jgi:superfamily I DNA and/or RNA helicase